MATPHTQQSQEQTIIPLLSEVVVSGTELAEAAKTAASEKQSIAVSESHPVDQQLLERLVPTVGAVIEANVRQALSGAVHQIARNVLAQLHQHLSINFDETTSTATQQPPECSSLTTPGEKPL